jgi:hypothetical protein
MGSLKEAADLLVFNQNVKTVRGKFVGSIIRPTNMPDADLNLLKTNIMT